MSSSRINPAPRLLDSLAKLGVFAEHPVSLLDVGCSLGLEAHWRSFVGGQLRAIGVDPLLDEIDRLRSIETDANVSYVDAWITFPGYEPGADPIQQSYSRSSAWAVALNGITSTVPTARLSERHVSVDELMNGTPIDFIKIDTDGSDFQVLLSANDTLRDALGVSIEVQFHGSYGDGNNTFPNIDTFLRSHGFSLFDLDVARYSRAALPDRFEYIIPAQTPRGQIVWGEAVYFRDAGDGSRPRLQPVPAAKLVAFYELYGLNDCAAEVIETHREAFSSIFPADEALDILAAEWHLDTKSYIALRQRFRDDYRSFYPPPPTTAYETIPDWVERGRSGN